jgi:nucleoid DNA-binding protein
MNKSELSEALYRKFEGRKGMSKEFAGELVNSIFGVASRSEEGSILDRDGSDGFLASHLLGGASNKVTLPGFGTFSVAYRQARQGRHPSKKDASGKALVIDIPETYVITFRAGKALKTAAANIG